MTLMNKSKTILPLLCMSAAACSAQGPNVVFIYVDDLGFGDISVNGATGISTPNIDQLASTGINFTNAHSAAAVSTPSRYALLTGEYPWRREGTGILKGDAGLIISPDRFTMADMFQSSGYVTGAIGKWHLGLGKTAEQDWNGTVSPNPSDIGFDYSYIIPATGDRTPCVFMENGRVVNLSSDDPLYVSYTGNFDGEPTGKDNPELLRMKFSAGHNQSIVNGISRIGYQKGGKSALWRDEDIADTLVSKARTFISDNRSRPFFLYFATHDIHVPRMPHERFQGKNGMGLRGDAILQLDWTVGEIVKTLKENGCYENTLIVFSSDNGPVLDDGYVDGAIEKVGNHRISGKYRSGKASVFEGGTRVPMIVSWPASVKPGQSDALVAQIDWFASLASLSGCRMAEDAAPDSRDCLDVMMGKPGEGRDYIVTMSGRDVLMLIRDGYKYIEASALARTGKKEMKKDLGLKVTEQLYNLMEDPSETEDISSREPEILKTMGEILEKEKSKGFRQEL